MVGKVELKDLVKDVLGEIQQDEQQNKNHEDEMKKVQEIQDLLNEGNTEEESEPVENSEEETSVESKSEQSGSSDEKQFLTGLRERLLVLFEGFNSPNNRNVEAKLDLTVNFLELVLARVEERLESIDDSSKEK